MGEAGPEAILPLTRVGGKLGVRASGGGGGIVLNIDARGAESGVASQIENMIYSMSDGIVEAAVARVVEQADRGGVVAGAFGT
jgi:phage-related minor tail protein